MAKIKTIVSCPTCAEAGVQNSLMQELGEDAAFCEAGHTFDKLPGLVEEPTVAVTEFEPTPVAAPEVPAMVEATQQAAEDISAAMSVPPMVLDGPPSTETAEAVAQAAGPELETLGDVTITAPQEMPNLPSASPLTLDSIGESTAPPVEAFNPAPEPVGDTLEEGTVKFEDNGDILICMKIPEEVATPIRNLAQEAGVPFFEYWKERWEFALANGWFV